MRCICVCMLVLVGFASLAKGEVLEMRLVAIGAAQGQDVIPFDVVDGISNGGNGVLEVVVVWDTDAVPTTNNGATIRFPILDYTITFRDMVFGGQEDIVITREDGGVEMEWVYRISDRTLKIGMTYSQPPQAGGVFHIELFGMGDSFSGSMTSLPNNRIDYAVGLPNAPTGAVEFNWLNFNPVGSSVSGTQFMGNLSSNGRVSYIVRVHTPPPAEPCSPADLNGDGEIDFLDISEFLTHFAAGCP